MFGTCPSVSLSSVHNLIVNTLEATVLIQSSWNLVIIIFSMTSLLSSHLCHIGSQTSSWGQIRIIIIKKKTKKKKNIFSDCMIVIAWCLSSIRQQLPSNNFSSETSRPTLKKLHRNNPWAVLYQSCSNDVLPRRTLVALANERKNFKNLLHWNSNA